MRSLEIRTPREAGLTDADILLAPEAHLHGRLLDAGGLPVPHASIQVDGGQTTAALVARFLREANEAWTPGVWGGHGKGRVRSDAEGRFVIAALAPGEYVLRVSLRNEAGPPPFIEGGWPPVHLRAGEVLEDLEIRLPDPGEGYIPGQVHGPDGRPIADVALPPGGSIAGWAVDGRTGDAIPSLDIHVHRREGPSISGIFDAVDGSFQIKGLAAGPADLWIKARGSTLSRILKVTVPPGEMADPLEVRLHPPTELRGTVRTATGGDPVAGAVVAGLFFGDQTSFFEAPTVTAKDGSFLLEGVPVGEPELVVRHEAFALARLPLEVQPEGSREIEILLSPGWTLAGTLLQAERPLPDGRVAAQALDDPSDLRATTCDEQGRYRLLGLRPTAYRILAYLPEPSDADQGEAIVELELTGTEGQQVRRDLLAE